MMTNDNNKCPVCGSVEHESIVVNGEWTNLVIHSIGSVHLHACISCGTVYLPNLYLKQIERRIKND